MMRILEYSFYQEKKTGRWVGGILANDTIVFVDKMCDAALYLGVSNSRYFPKSKFKREWVRIKKFTPSRPTGKLKKARATNKRVKKPKVSKDKEKVPAQE